MYALSMAWPSLVAEDAHAPGRRAALDFEHLLALEPGEPRVREVEGDGDARDAIRREPLVGQPEMRPEADAARRPAPRGARRCASASTLPSIDRLSSDIRRSSSLSSGHLAQIGACAAARGGGSGGAASGGAGGRRGPRSGRAIGCGLVHVPRMARNRKNANVPRAATVPECAGKRRLFMTWLRQSRWATRCCRTTTMLCETCRPALHWRASRGSLG